MAERYLQPYRDAVLRYGAGFSALLWSSREGQQTRFDVMIDLVDPEACRDTDMRGLATCTILDVGCGTGDFAQRLLDRDVKFSQYVGVDAVSEMIDAARERKLERCEFIVADVLTDESVLRDRAPDYACISGTLNTMDEDTARRLVHRCFEASAQGVVFNFLSNRPDEQWHDKDLGPARRFDTIRWLDWALHITPRMRFAQDYLDGHDATIVMRRE